jgi:Tol biopolymer transport system component
MARCLAITVLMLALLLGCRPTLGQHDVVISVDGKDIPLLTNVRTVREALTEADVTLNADDRVEPDLWVAIESGMAIRVIRVQEEIIVENQAIPYRQETIKSEALPAGEQKLLQAGKNGQAEVTYRLQFENGVEVSRSVLSRVVMQEAISQITVIGVEGVVDSVQIPGTIAYLNRGNAWIMRVTSGGRHPVTSQGNLDGHVFALSPDGTHLLYSVPTDTVEYDGPFNDLYLLNVVVVDESPVKLTIGDVLWADWSPDGRRIAYSTGVKSGPPGWKAHNDLWVADLFDSQGRRVEPKPKRILPPQTNGAYSWWGSQFAWSPDGYKIAYARPEQVGYIDMQTGRAFPLAPFVALNTHRDWVWLPTPTWSPDSRFIACAIHGTEPGRPDEESQRFEVWAFDLTQTIRARLTNSVGMWSNPLWSPTLPDGQSLIAYAEADTPFSSYDSGYVLRAMDRDGSNKRILFPIPGQMGIAPPVTYDWSPNGLQFVVIYQGNLYLYDMVSEQVQQLTGDGQCEQLDWKK